MTVGKVHITDPGSQQPLTLEVDGLYLDAQSRAVKIDGRSISDEISPIQFVVLAEMMRYPTRVFSAEQLARVAHSTPDSIDRRLVDLRQKLDRNRFIITRRGVGYSLVRP